MVCNNLSIRAFALDNIKKNIYINFTYLSFRIIHSSQAKIV